VGGLGTDLLRGGLGDDVMTGVENAAFIFFWERNDVISFGGGATTYYTDVTTDFKAGLGGDVLDFSVLLRDYNPQSSNLCPSRGGPHQPPMFQPPFRST